MKLQSITYVALLSLLVAWTTDPAAVAFAAEPGTFLQPALITPVGQTADGLLLNVVCRQAGIKVMYNNLIDSLGLDSLEAGLMEVPVSMRGSGPVKTLILVPGGSTKGLGAAKINEKVEMERVDQLVARARQLGMKIIVCHLGGESRRGALSDPFNTQAAEVGDAIVVVRGGNNDGFFTNIAEPRGVPIYEVEEIGDLGDVLNQLFLKE